MQEKSRAVIINEITEDISEKLGTLTRYGVLSFNDSVAIITTLNNKQCTWLSNNAATPDVIKFLNEVV